MSTRIKFFRDYSQVKETKEFLLGHSIRTYIRQRDPIKHEKNEEPYGYDLFVLADDDLSDARKLLEYEYGSEWGENVA